MSHFQRLSRTPQASALVAAGDGANCDSGGRGASTEDDRQASGALENQHGPGQQFGGIGAPAARDLTALGTQRDIAFHNSPVFALLLGRGA